MLFTITELAVHFYLPMASRISRFRSVGLASRAFSSSNYVNHGVTKLTAASQDEMNHFNALASSWWDVEGPQRILHKMNLLRMDYINEMVRDHLKLNEGVESSEDEVFIPAFSTDLLPGSIKEKILEEQETRREEILQKNKLKVLDVGCGGGILSESLARLNFVESVRGIDLSSDVLEAARLHKANDPVLIQKLSYEMMAIEDLPITEKYDLITVFEMLEHVQYPSKILEEVFTRLEVGGWVFLSTINRDFISWFTTIFMGEHLLRVVPVGTHTLEKYINEEEIRKWLEKSKYTDAFQIADSRGCAYIPGCGWVFTPCPQVGNYFMAIQRIN